MSIKRQSTPPLLPTTTKRAARHSEMPNEQGGDTESDQVLTEENISQSL